MPDQALSIAVRAANLPSDRWLFINGLSGLTSFMAREGINDPEQAFQAFFDAAKHFHNLESDYNGKSFTDYLREKAAAKARRFNVAFPGVGDVVQEKIGSIDFAEQRRRIEPVDLCG
ncbi:hypothetical protein Q9L42_013695 [Methylomarinum sp. Ch1-1]|uniref:Uncharacterized protein n=1 Tax=Methylomarinum roseum TaxID=3067653 RepID=A0AAU7NR48_9GAMM|nr:hypothetical protein [Methylomarinum sp. Ch1-1]MDP4520630.1 hypothetical protein [Methylomarinum sp. Ch1-1]